MSEKDLLSSLTYIYTLSSVVLKIFMHKQITQARSSSAKGMTKDATGVLPFAPLLLLSMPKAYYSFKSMDLLSAGVSKLDFNFIWKDYVCKHCLICWLWKLKCLLCCKEQELCEHQIKQISFGCSFSLTEF